MTLTEAWEPRVSRKVCGGVLSAALHVALLFVVLTGGRHYVLRTDDALTSMRMLLAPPESEIVEVPLPGPALPTPASDEQLAADIARLAPPPPMDSIAPPPAEIAPPAELPAEVTEPSPVNDGELPATVAMSDAEKSALSRRLEQLAEQSLDAQRTEVSWEQDGRTYSAVLIRERGNDGTALERVVAEVSTSDRGKNLKTRVNLRRLAFSQFTQVVDKWDPMVQLHDDEIVGRFHSNSQLKLLYDSRTAPKFSGKVTTAARGFDTESHGRRRDSDIFRGGVETRASRIKLPEALQPFEWAPKDENARVHEFTGDTHIRFLGDGSYAWRPRGSREQEHFSDPTERPVYLIGTGDTTLYVQGVVAGRVLVYSPHRIVIESSLTYARDPRDVPDSGDYVGLVSNRYVEVASPGVTGPGDLEIDAAIFAGRRFLVRNIDRGRAATLRIYGSLSAGSLSATEPRYATKIEYDTRFERQRPPGFPSTNRHEAADWDGQWAEASVSRPN